MKKAITLLLSVMSFLVYGQAEIEPCSQHIQQEQRFLEHPEERAQVDAAMGRIFTSAKKNQERFTKEDETLIIPVVFHIVHDNGPENIDESQVYDAVEVMNLEFSKRNSAAQNVVAAFQDIVADCAIQFRLATLDPDGNCTNGIIRYLDPRTAEAGDNVKQGRQWPTNKYLNIYVVRRIASGAAGYAYYPGNSPQVDGIVILSNYVGGIGTGTPGRASALTHEVGHYLALPHVWGSTNNPEEPDNCSSDDGIEDTPNCLGSRNCSLNKQTCGSLDNIQNFMEYAYCYANFTNGQKAVMRSTLEGIRSEMVSEDNNIETGTNYDEGELPQILCKADFTKDINSPSCPGSIVTFTDRSFTHVESRLWTFEGGTPATSTEANPVVVYDTPGEFSVTLEVQTGALTKSITKPAEVKIVDDQILSMPLVEDFQGISDILSSNEYSVSNPDNDRTWTIADVGYDDNSSIYINSRRIVGTGKLDYFITNTIDASNYPDMDLTFRYAYAPKSDDGNDDKLVVEISEDCGVTWKTRTTLRGARLQTADAVPVGDFEPSSPFEWKEKVVPVSGFNVSGFMFRFVWTSGGGNNIYVDNINLSSNAVSVNELKTETLKVYPNPTSAELFISWGDLSAHSIKVLNITGSVVEAHEITERDEVRLDVRNLTPGVYFVKIEGEGIMQTKKVVINRP